MMPENGFPFPLMLPPMNNPDPISKEILTVFDYLAVVVEPTFVEQKLFGEDKHRWLIVLIGVMETYPQIWNYEALLNNKNDKSIKNGWSELAFEVFQRSGHLLKKQTLRTAWGHLKSAYFDNRIKFRITGSSDWKYYTHMSFMQDVADKINAKRKTELIVTTRKIRDDQKEGRAILVAQTIGEPPVMKKRRTEEPAKFHPPPLHHVKPAVQGSVIDQERQAQIDRIAQNQLYWNSLMLAAQSMARVPPPPPMPSYFHPTFLSPNPYFPKPAEFKSTPITLTPSTSSDSSPKSGTSPTLPTPNMMLPNFGPGGFLPFPFLAPPAPLLSSPPAFSTPPTQASATPSWRSQATSLQTQINNYFRKFHGQPENLEKAKKEALRMIHSLRK